MSEGGTHMDSVTAGFSERVRLLNGALFCGQGWQENWVCEGLPALWVWFTPSDKCSCLWLIICTIQPPTQIKRMTSRQMLQQTSKKLLCSCSTNRPDWTRSGSTLGFKALAHFDWNGVINQENKERKRKKQTRLVIPHHGKTLHLWYPEKRTEQYVLLMSLQPCFSTLSPDEGTSSCTGHVLTVPYL